GRTVGDLGRDSRGNLPPLTQRLEFGHLLQRGVPARTLVGAHPVDRRDLPLEPALVDGADGPHVTLVRELLELLALDSPLLAHQLRAAELGDLLLAVPVPPALPVGEGQAL